MAEAVALMFRNGPLAENNPNIHSLVVYMKGDGMHSAGAYIMDYDENGKPTGQLTWNPRFGVE